VVELQPLAGWWVTGRIGSRANSWAIAETAPASPPNRFCSPLAVRGTDAAAGAATVAAAEVAAVAAAAAEDNPPL